MTDLNLIIAVVVQYKNSVQFALSCHQQIGRVLDTFRQRLTRILLHLDVEKFPAQKKTSKPLNAVRTESCQLNIEIVRDVL